MRQWPINHLTADDLDAFHSASLSVEAREHLEECAECRTLTLQDQALLTALAKLAAFEPAPGFANRVMARVELSRPVLVRFKARRLALAASVIVALGASIIWSLFNRTLLLSWLDHSATEIGHGLWVGVRVVATNLTEQPWFSGLRGFASSSARVALTGGGLLIGYGAAVYALRRLLVPPSRPVPHADW